MIVSYHTKTNAMNPAEWESAVDGIGSYIERVLSADNAEELRNSLLEKDPVYKNMGSEEIRRAWALCLEQIRIDDIKKYIYEELLSLWNKYSFGGRKASEVPSDGRLECVVSVTFLAEATGTGYKVKKNGLPLIAVDPVEWNNTEQVSHINPYL